jgi:hypothetical protein
MLAHPAACEAVGSPLSFASGRLATVQRRRPPHERVASTTVAYQRDVAAAMRSPNSRPVSTS